MKKYLIFAVFILLFVEISAQDKKHKVNLGIGLLSSNQFLSTFSDVIIPIMTQEEIISRNSVSYGTFHLGYHYNFSERISIGGVGVYDYEKADAYFQDIKAGNFYNNFYSLAAEADFKYINKEKFRFYSLIGIGGTLYSQAYEDSLSKERETRTLLFFNFQVTPVGLEFGNSLGGFLELGFGYKGIVSAGVFGKF